MRWPAMKPAPSEARKLTAWQYRREYPTAWQAPRQGTNPDAVEPLAAKYAAEWPAWGLRKVRALLAADGHAASEPAVGRAMRRRG